MLPIITLSLATARPFPHQEQLTPAPRQQPSKSGQYLTPDVTVYGYHPYWGGDPLDDLTPLTHIAIFDVGMNTNGQITDTAYWHSVAEDLVTKAHGGVKVHSFDSSVTPSTMWCCQAHQSKVAEQWRVWPILWCGWGEH